MAILPIRKYPDPVLRTPAKPVTIIDDRLRRLAADMAATMKDANGVGLAAPQVGESIRLVVIDFDPEKHDPRAFINPVIVKRSGRKEACEEGCLSFPGLRTWIKRSPKVEFEAQNLDGETVRHEVEALTARAVQHEIDHLDGLLFVDKAGPSDRQSLRGELEELEQEYKG